MFECLGDGNRTVLRLAVDGRPIGDVVHPKALNGGGIGVATATGRFAPVTVLFDNFAAARL
ncbi:MAG TPA: hypothetical protein VG795_04910 [Acidimicrobiia bacterium]|nr:hypothetical protein [Acidimicrobiia bacterium]